ncbi:putative MFS family arabinose efflux permease [Streptomyces sp. SLBN-118]|uniref:MFS transporter n=1 Tax=Streptomyces sp. SLBN-118 TaxID=2768454 RepID=UPI001170CF51|nr:MFS transporter [Streptomyces sp. SLBN-118]TQK42555.1 putative MFS family arabinose efflux permease [Streptomyces sp. SLBN-118]
MSDRKRGSHRRVSTSPWKYVVATWFAGVLAAVGLGAVSPAGAALRSSLGLSTGELAWATSSITAVSAVLGIPAGWWIRRLGAHRALSWGLFVMSVATVAGATAGSWGMLLGSRIAEGVGYLLVFVAGPVVLTRVTRGGIRSAALALWGTCVPMGLAITAAAGGVLASRWTWNRWLALTALGPLIMAGVLTAVLPRLPRAPVQHPYRAVGAWKGALRLGAAYGSLSLVGVAVVMVLPLFLTERREVTPTAAGTLVALVCLGSAVGGLAASWLLRRGLALSSLVPLGALMPVACLPAFSAEFPLAVSGGAATLVLLVDGLLISAVFAAVPAAVSRAEDVDVANGILNQLGSVGMLMGPPVFGVAIAAAGWGAVAAATFVFGGLGTVLLLPGARTSGTGTAHGVARSLDAQDRVDVGEESEPLRKALDVSRPNRNRI